MKKKIEYPKKIIFFNYIHNIIIKIRCSSYFPNHFMTSSIILLKKITSKSKKVVPLNNDLNEIEQAYL